MCLAPIFPTLVLDGTVVDRVTELKVLGVVLDTALAFQSRVRSITVSSYNKLEIMRRTLYLFGDPVLGSSCFWSFLLPLLEYFSPVWMPAAASHLDRVVSKAVRLSDGLVVGDFEVVSLHFACFTRFIVTPIMP